MGNSRSARSVAASSQKSDRAKVKTSGRSSVAARSVRVAVVSSIDPAAKSEIPTAVPNLQPQHQPPAIANHLSEWNHQQSQQREGAFVASSIVSEPQPEPQLSPSIEASFAKIPDEVKDPATAAPAEENEFSADDLRELMQELDDFEADDVKETLVECFEALSEYFGSDHWKLSDRQARMMGKPVARLLNSFWKELCKILPELFRKMAERFPGFAGTMAAGAIVCGPKAVKQWRIARERRSGVTRPAATPIRPASSPAPPPTSTAAPASRAIIPPGA